MLVNAKAFEMLHHPGRPRAGGDGRLQPEPAGFGQVALNPGQQLLHRRRLPVIQALQGIELIAIKRFAGSFTEVHQRIERSS